MVDCELILLLDYSVIEILGQVSYTSDLQFGFQARHCTDLLIIVLNESLAVVTLLSIAHFKKLRKRSIANT